MANGYGSSSTQSSTQSSSTSTATSGRIGVENQISNLTINTSDMPTATTQRSFRVVGGKALNSKLLYYKILVARLITHFITIGISELLNLDIVI